MNAAYHTTTTVLPGHKIEITAPELREGDEVRVVVLPVSPPAPGRLSGLEIIQAYKGPRAFASAEDIDRYINEERNSWDR